MRRRAGTIILGETKQGIVEALNDRPGALSLPFLSKYTRVLIVTTSPRTLEWTTKLPSKDPVREFPIEIALRVAPIDPFRLAGSSDYDFAGDIKLEVNAGLRQISREHSPETVGALEVAIEKWVFDRKLVASAFQASHGAIFVRMDQGLVSRKLRGSDDELEDENKLRAVQRRSELAKLIMMFLPNTPTRAAVAFDLASNPAKIAHYIDRIEQAYGEQQRVTIEKLEKLGELFRNGNLDTVDVASLVDRVLAGPPTVSLPALEGHGARKALPSG